MQIWWWDFITVEEIVKETIKNEGARGSFTVEELIMLIIIFIMTVTKKYYYTKWCIELDIIILKINIDFFKYILTI